MPAHQYGEYADLVAKGIRNLSVDLFNQTSDVAAALSLLEIGIVTAIGVEVKAHLRTKKRSFSDIRRKASGTGKSMTSGKLLKLPYLLLLLYFYFLFLLVPYLGNY